MEICDKCGNTIKDHWGGFIVYSEGDIICSKCLEENTMEENMDIEKIKLK